MNTITKILTTLTLTLAITGSVNAASFKATDNLATTQVCVAALKGSNIKLRKTIKENRLSNRYVANKVFCNDLHIMQFVTKYGKSPEKINSMLSKYRTPQRVEITDFAKL